MRQPKWITGETVLKIIPNDRDTLAEHCATDHNSRVYTSDILCAVVEYFRQEATEEEREAFLAFIEREMHDYDPPVFINIKLGPAWTNLRQRIEAEW